MIRFLNDYLRACNDLHVGFLSVSSQMMEKMFFMLKLALLKKGKIYVTRKLFLTGQCVLSKVQVHKNDNFNCFY